MNIKKYFADILSLLNFACGIGSIIAAYFHRVDISLFLLLGGALFDGLDGAAARKFGGTRFGVLADDIADGLNYGVAPGAALVFALNGIQGLILGPLFAIFTISRLIYFTLNKAHADPNYFSGVPSTVGGLLVLCSIYLWKNEPALLGFIVGLACVQMVSFDTHYRHLGRWVLNRKDLLYIAPPYLGLLAAGGYLFGLRLPISLILGLSLIYGFLPVLINFREVVRKSRSLKSELTDPPLSEEIQWSSNRDGS